MFNGMCNGLNKLNLSKKIKLVISDFDGIFTDNGLYLTNELAEMKKISFKDIMGVSLLIRQGIKFAIISGEGTDVPDYFKRQFGIEDIYKGIKKKLLKTQEIAQKYGVTPDEVLYIGDDVLDLEPLLWAGYKVTVPQANWRIKEVPGIQITQSLGGDGAIREIIDNLLSE